MPNLSVQPNDRITFAIRHEDSQVIVVNKPPGVVSLPGLGHEDDTLLNGLFARVGTKLQKLGRARDFGMLHRLDRETSGLLMVALTREAYDALRADFAARRIEKFYWAVARGAPSRGSGVIRKPIEEFEGRLGDDPSKRKLARISSRGKPALTAYRVLADSGKAALIECRPVTGRLHQVRVHLDSVGAAILGDDAYGPAEVRHAWPRLALHAHAIHFTHPATGEKIRVNSPWPNDLKGLLTRTGLPRPDLAPPPPKASARVDGPHEVDDDTL